MSEEICIICEKPWNDGSLVCHACEEEFWSDPEAVLGYFHFCGVPATMEQILELMGK
jgi:hypothetical protein